MLVSSRGQKIDLDAVSPEGKTALDSLLRKFDPGQPRAPAGGPDGGQWTDGGGGSGDPAVEVAGAVATTAVEFVTSAGTSILDMSGKPMLRPEGLSPQLFVAEGRKIRGLLETSAALSSDGASSGLGALFAGLRRFRQGGDWDAQRVGGSFRPEFVDYATVSIGIYSASAGLKLEHSLAIQNVYAYFNSRYPASTIFDSTFTSLPERNVWNTRLGYELTRQERLPK